MPLETCSVTGEIRRADGEPIEGSVVSAWIKSRADDKGGQIASGVGVTSDPVQVFSGEDGTFQIPLLRGGVFLIEIPDINLRKEIAVPSVDTIELKDLI